tara:strand:- start:1873 stop:2073 length:201 start_codon:yes stop_codon:yes gene_type:complete
MALTKICTGNNNAKNIKKPQRSRKNPRTAHKHSTKIWIWTDNPNHFSILRKIDLSSLDDLFNKYSY